MATGRIAESILIDKSIESISSDTPASIVASRQSFGSRRSRNIQRNLSRCGAKLLARGGSRHRSFAHLNGFLRSIHLAYLFIVNIEKLLDQYQELIFMRR